MRRVLLLTTMSVLCFRRHRRCGGRPAAGARRDFVPVAYNWTGLYLGINGGYAWGSSRWSGYANNADPSGVMVGGTIGYNWQALGSPWVFGLEGDIDWTNIKGTFTSVTCPTGCQTKNTWLHAVASATPGIA